MTVRLAVLVSGGGTTLQNLVDRIADGSLAAEIALVIPSSEGTLASERARRAGLPLEVASTKRVPVAQYSREIFDHCRRRQVDLVVLAGYLNLLEVPDDFSGRVMNIHPSLIPSFCGKGYYGLHVHQAVLDRGVKITGCTVHFVDNDYDAGPIILQKAVEVHEGDDAQTLQKRVFEAERQAYPEAIRLFAEGRLAIDGAVVRVRS